MPTSDPAKVRGYGLSVDGPGGTCLYGKVYVGETVSDVARAIRQIAPLDELAIGDRVVIEAVEHTPQELADMEDFYGF